MRLHNVALNDEYLIKRELASNVDFWYVDVSFYRWASIAELSDLQEARPYMRVAEGFLPYTEHPPDTQRGWDLLPAVFIPTTTALAGMHRLGRYLHS